MATGGGAVCLCRDADAAHVNAPLGHGCGVWAHVAGGFLKIPGASVIQLPSATSGCEEDRNGGDGDSGEQFDEAV